MQINVNGFQQANDIEPCQNSRLS